MIVAVASGKGGTGKTTVATSLAHVAASAGRTVAYLDCDVEEPNGRLFLAPAIDHETPIEKPTPAIDHARCTHCGQCAAACRYGAIAALPNKTLVFAELCHACGGCVLACPSGAIGESPREIGVLRCGAGCEARFIEGELQVGEAMSPPAIRAVKAAAPAADLVLLDSPPGTSCPVVETVRGCDLVVLVSEPTPFGLYDLGLALEMVRELGLPSGVVVNRAEEGNGRVHDFCQQRGVPLLAEIPDDRAVAEAYSRGELIVEAVPGYAERIRGLLERIEDVSWR
jgi:MinD superfamily P-loop ATPase